MKTNKLSSWNSLKKGDKFIVDYNSNGHNYPLDTVLTLKRDGESSTIMTDAAEGYCGNSLDIRDIRLLDFSVAELKEEMASLQEQLDKIAEKIKYCEEHGLQKFDSTEYDIYKALTIVESKKTRKEKAELLTKLIKK